MTSYISFIEVLLNYNEAFQILLKQFKVPTILGNPRVILMILSFCGLKPMVCDDEFLPYVSHIINIWNSFYRLSKKTFAYYILLYNHNTVHMYVYMFSLSFKIFSLKTCSLNDKSKWKKRKPQKYHVTWRKLFSKFLHISTYIYITCTVCHRF